MRIRNKKNGTNTLAYKAGATIQKIIIPSGVSVEINGLLNLNQIINISDFKRGWFEVVSAKEIAKEKISGLKKAKEEAEEYSVEEKIKLTNNK